MIVSHFPLVCVALELDNITVVGGVVAHGNKLLRHTRKKRGCLCIYTFISVFLSQLGIDNSPETKTFFAIRFTAYFTFWKTILLGKTIYQRANSRQ